MPRGLYRDNGGWVHIDYDGKFERSLHRNDYEDLEYKPAFEALPLKGKYEKKKSAKKS